MSEPFDQEGFVRYFNRRLDQFAKGEHNLKTPVLDTLELLKDSLDVTLISVKHGPGRAALEAELSDKLNAQFGSTEETLSNLNSILDALKEFHKIPERVGYKCPVCGSTTWAYPGKSAVACKWGRCNGVVRQEAKGG